MVIIEVDRYFDRFDALLGKHLWSSFLKHPKEGDRDKASKVFWCYYNTGRTVQMNGESSHLKLATRRRAKLGTSIGWKRVGVEERWFQGWSPNNEYAATHSPAQSSSVLTHTSPTGT